MATEYDYPFAKSVSTSEMASLLAYCGQAHWQKDVVKYHCYPVPE
jgi:hypothetical protein